MLHFLLYSHDIMEKVRTYTMPDFVQAGRTLRDARTTVLKDKISLGGRQGAVVNAKQDDALGNRRI